MQAVADKDTLIQRLAILTAGSQAILNYLTSDNTTSSTPTSTIPTSTFEHALCQPQDAHRLDRHHHHHDNNNYSDPASALAGWAESCNIGSSVKDHTITNNMPVVGGDPTFDAQEVQSLLDLGLANLLASQQLQPQLQQQQQDCLSWDSLFEGTPSLSLFDQSLVDPSPVSLITESPLGITDTLATLLDPTSPLFDQGSVSFPLFDQLGSGPVDPTLAAILAALPPTPASEPSLPQLSQTDWLSIAATALAQASAVPPDSEACTPVSSVDALLSSCLLPPSPTFESSPSVFRTSPSFSPLDTQCISLAEPLFAPLSHLQESKPLEFTPEQLHILAQALLPQPSVPPPPPPIPPSKSSSVGPVRRKRGEVVKHEDEADDDDRRHACDFPGCTRAFKRLFNLKAHKRTHDPDRDRPFSCDTCHATFLRAHDLQRHQPVHTKVKEWSCDLCGRSFTRKDALDRHESNPTACRAKHEQQQS